MRFVWENAHRFSLAHDVSDGGVELALRECEEWSGIAAHAEPIAGEGVIVATLEPLDWDDVVELGRV